MTTSIAQDPIGWICETCGVQSTPSVLPPSRCLICSDERQYVGWDGQRWAAPADLRISQQVAFTDEDGVTTLVLAPGFGINQRAFLIPHAGGNVMWECLATVTDEAVARINELGGVTAIAISHPHFYAAMVEWSAALGDVPIYLHAEDRDWIQRTSPNIRLWRGDRLELAASIELVHLGGHFDGSAGLWWTDGPRGGGALFPGDAIQIVMDRRFATFMYSYPNAIPLGPRALLDLQRRVAPLAFDDVFGFSTGRQMIGGAKAAIDKSFDRYRSAIAA
ncbi:MBL fold metallo-hydrolase [Caulobacter sp.]|uniref:MBL fold metallo-hydrolase n=1 Tax=Caulobacter sp. TaxID=78 RepID=UPI003BAACF1A